MIAREHGWYWVKFGKEEWLPALYDAGETNERLRWWCNDCPMIESDFTAIGPRIFPPDEMSDGKVDIDWSKGSVQTVTLTEDIEVGGSRPLSELNPGKLPPDTVRLSEQPQHEIRDLRSGYEEYDYGCQEWPVPSHAQFTFGGKIYTFEDHEPEPYTWRKFIKYMRMHVRSAILMAAFVLCGITAAVLFLIWRAS